MSSGKPVTEADTEIMRAAAVGRLSDGPISAQADAKETADLLGVAIEELERRRSAIEAERRAANEALVDARIQARLDGIDLKLAKAGEVLGKVQDRSIRRMYEGRIRNLGLQREDVVAELDAKRGLAVTTQPVAVALLEIVP